MIISEIRANESALRVESNSSIKFMIFLYLILISIMDEGSTNEVI